MIRNRMDIAQLFGRLVLGLSFLSAVMDRLGYWGAPGEPNVAWGNWASFLDYTHLLLPFVSKGLSDVAALTATILEVLFAVLLIVGYRTRWVAFGSSMLLLVFGLSMMVFLGIKTPFDYSVLSACAAAFLLSGVSYYRWSLDALRNR